MWHTRAVLVATKEGRYAVEERFEGGYPEWKLVDGILDSGR
jgi:hypothetical protein